MSSHFLGTVSALALYWLCTGFALAFNLLRTGFALASLWLRTGFALAWGYLYTCFALASHLLRTCFALASRHWLRTCFALASHLLRTCFALASHLLCTCFALASHWLHGTGFALASHWLCTCFALASHWLRTCGWLVWSSLTFASFVWVWLCFSCFVSYSTINQSVWCPSRHPHFIFRATSNVRRLISSQYLFIENIINVKMQLNQQERPYHSDSTASRLLSEVKHCWARLVLRWGTMLESLVLFFCNIL